MLATPEKRSIRCQGSSSLIRKRRCTRLVWTCSWVALSSSSITSFFGSCKPWTPYTWANSQQRVEAECCFFDILLTYVDIIQVTCWSLATSCSRSSLLSSSCKFSTLDFLGFDSSHSGLCNWSSGHQSLKKARKASHSSSALLTVDYVNKCLPSLTIYFFNFSLEFDPQLKVSGGALGHIHMGNLSPCVIFSRLEGDI